MVLDVDHESFDDLDVVLSAPNGRTTVLVSDVGGAHPLEASLIVTDSTMGGPPPPFGDEDLTGTTGLATDHDTTSGDVDAFPASAPPSLPALSGSDAQGDWTLTAYDDTPATSDPSPGGRSESPTASAQRQALPPCS